MCVGFVIKISILDLLPLCPSIFQYVDLNWHLIDQISLVGALVWVFGSWHCFF